MITSKMPRSVIIKNYSFEINNEMCCGFELKLKILCYLQPKTDTFTPLTWNSRRHVKEMCSETADLTLADKI